MNREIKFRGKDIASNKWLFGDLRHYKGDVCIFEHGGNKGEQVKPETVGQFTGLKDKEDNKIFEDDIVYAEFEDKSNGLCLIGWNDEECAFGLMDEWEYRALKEGYTYPKFCNHTLLNFLKKAKIFKVIGNIHEDPELLNG